MIGAKRQRRQMGRPAKRARVMRRFPRRVPRNRFRALQYPCVKRFWLENWQPSAASTNGFWRYFAFSIGQLPDYATLNATFDTYRIGGIKVEFHPRYNSFEGNDTTDTVLPGITNQTGTRMSLLRDQLSSLLPTGAYNSATYNSFLEQGSPRTFTGNRPFSIYFKPFVASTVGTTVGGKRRRPGFLQLELGSAVPHAGFFAFAWDPNFSGTFGNSFDILVTYYVTFRGAR